MAKSNDYFSEQWFTALAGNMHGRRASFEALGCVECTMVLVSTNSPERKLIELRFRAYGVESVRRLARLEDADPDHFTLTATAQTWREMFDNIVSNGQPDLEHTLNFLTFPDDPMVVDGPDQLHIDAFYRYNQSLQLFFNGAADLAAAVAA
jgi:hypothetical protein